MADLNLIVVRSNDVEAARSFYKAIGLTFTKERHGTGPEHFAANLGNLVFEIYPQNSQHGTEKVRLGFHVVELSKTLDSLRKIRAKLISEPKPSPWGLRAVVEDPDGRKIELIERDQQ